MRNRLGLIAAVVLLLAVLGGLGTWALRRAARTTEPGLARVPRDAFLVAGVDLARVRAYPPASRMRWAVAHEPDVARVLTAVHAGCGFDPIDRLDAVTLAWDRSALEASPARGWSLVLEGRLDRAQWERCFSAAAQSGGGRAVPLGPIGQHATFGYAAAGEPLPRADAWFALAGAGMVAAPPDALPRALAAVDGTDASATGNDRLRAAVGSVGSRALAFVAIDAAAVSQRAPQEWAGAVAGALAGTPAASAVPALLGARTLAAAVQQTPAGLRVVATVRLDSPAHAQALAAALLRWRDAGRGDFAQSVARVQGEYLARLQAAQAFEPGLAAQSLPLQQAGLLLGALYERARVRGEGVTVTLELPLEAADVATLEAAARAALECDAAYERTRPQRDAAAGTGEGAPPTPTPTPGGGI